jgi:hypothetical protein
MHNAAEQLNSCSLYLNFLCAAAAAAAALLCLLLLSASLRDISDNFAHTQVPAGHKLFIHCRCHPPGAHSSAHILLMWFVLQCHICIQCIWAYLILPVAPVRSACTLTLPC